MNDERMNMKMRLLSLTIPYTHMFNMIKLLNHFVEPL